RVSFLQAPEICSGAAATTGGWSRGQGPVQKLQDVLPVDLAADLKHVAMPCSRHEQELAWANAAAVECLGIDRWSMRVFRAGHDQHRRGGQVCHVLDRGQLFQAQTEAPFGNPDDAMSQPLEPGRV